MDSTMVPGPTASKTTEELEAKIARRALMHVAHRVTDGSEAHRLTMTAVTTIDDLLEELDR